jgi:hypothetical protein
MKVNNDEKAMKLNSQDFKQLIGVKNEKGQFYDFKLSRKS